MASSSAIWREYQQLSQVHYTADNFYNQSFMDRINEAQRNIDNLVAQKNEADAKKQQSQDAYNTFYGEMRDYSSLTDESEDKFGVTTAMENYEKSKYAVAAVEQQIEALPSTINRNSGVVMSQQRRELAYNSAADKWGKTMNTRQNQMDVNKEVWDKARANANAYAEQLYGEQQKDLKSLALQWSTNTGLFQQATENWQNARSWKSNLESEYRSWQWQQAELQNQYARARAEDAFNRYRVQLQYERTAALERQMIERQRRQDQFDFGNGYTLRRNGDNEAVYFKNGRQITAGQFVEGTGANGANWNMWNTVWNQGVSTKGVGSDTVEAFNWVSSTNPKYNYLFTYF